MRKVALAVTSMRDPFFEPPLALVQAAQPLANSLALRTLPLHVHEILPAFCVYQFFESAVAPPLSQYLFPKSYSKLSKRTRRNWDIHFVSFVQSCFINGVALWVMYADKERNQMDWRERVWGYSGAIGMVQGFTTGYFIWDFVTCAKDVAMHGPGALAHSISALAVSLLGFRPFVNYHGLNFVLYELSTPFLNIHWFLDKLDMTGSTLQWYNGAILIVTFGTSRLVWGSYATIRLYQDVRRAIQSTQELPVPTWLAVAYLASTAVFTGLNFYWFAKMIKTIRSRFDKPRQVPDRKDD